MHIVVADPSRTVLKLVSRLLVSDGHEVSVFIDGQEALDFVRADRTADALITSTELTPMSGLELCWEARLLSGHDRAIYIILMSSNADQKHLINALDSGADELISKPPVKEELYARLRSAERQLRLQRELIRLATVDPLTGVLNRRAFFEKAQQSLAAAGAGGTLSAIMFDVDHFKLVNDGYGHDVGDQVLRAVGGEAPSAGAVVGRLGGEEFAVLLEDANLDAGVEHAERLRMRLGALAFDTARGNLSVTCSFGVAERQDGETVDQLLKRADAALYKAKGEGRNRVVSAQCADFDATDAQWSRLLRSDPREGAQKREGPQPSSFHTDLLAAWSSNVEGNMPQSPGSSLAQPSAGQAFVLDDESQIGLVVCKTLEACGLTARQFTSPEPFLAELQASPPGLVVLDLSLGQSDAVEVIHKLEHTKYRGKVLLISGRDEMTLKEITQIGGRHGLNMLPPLKKPFRPADVRQRLTSHVAEATRAPALADKIESSAEERPVIRIAEALRNNWLELWYQPKVDLKSGRVRAAEGLIRANHPIQGVIPPKHFLPPAGDPAYQPLTRFAIERAVADWARFARQGLPVKLSVNAPASVIHTPDFIAHLRSVLPKDAEFPGLTIEVTEDEIIRDSDWAREVANQLKLYNIDLSIDDFGAGYASLSRLNDLPFSEVKIDRSFVCGCGSDKIKHSLCQTVVDLAHRFGATACAEGVETTEDLRAVMAMGFDTAQGFLFAKPMPAASFMEAAWLDGAGAVSGILRASPEGQRLAQIA